MKYYSRLSLSVFLTSLFLLTQNVSAEEYSCEDLINFKMDGYNISINKAATIPEGKMSSGPFGPPAYDGVIPAYCRVDGEIDKRIGHEGKPYAIGFAIALPKVWNGRFMFQGGGGMNGTVADPIGAQGGGIPALARGFAVITSDTGHKSGGGAFDVSFMADQEAYMNFLYKAIGKVTAVGKKIVEKHYGKPISYSYYVGCSTGGREAMIMSQRYPDYYDGIVSGAPAMRTNYSNLGIKWMQVSLNQAAPLDANGEPVPGGGLLEKDINLLIDTFINSCDMKDGIKDGMVFNNIGCGFDPEVLICKGEKEGEDCLTEKQVKAVKQGLAGPVTTGGMQVYSPFAIDTGLNAKVGIPGLLVMTQSMLGPPSKETKMDIDREYIEKTDGVAAAGDTFLWTNLTTFSGHGGKLIFYHGMSDPWFSALDTVDYYNRLIRDNGGAEKVYEWSRIFLVPGMCHCSGGEKTVDTFDMLSAITDWVEKGITPDSIIATGKNLPGISRPLCPYPKYPHYKGTGDSNNAEYFECRNAD
ncbi:MAG: tannase/feruloyl esterase family alpha/beta hydrolase [Deltaproteobacteria bacterium]|nr:tannase/feruloyl esterase family alpha/beta hydrolase [Deltaproteobacteria bacterium]